MVGQFLIRNCAKANGDTSEVLPHNILYLSIRQPQSIASLGHTRTGFFDQKWTQYVNILTEQSFQFKDGRHEV